jgi:hypothetical protein
MTATSLVMQNRRGHASAKRTLRLPIIAPKEEVLEGKLDKSMIAPPRIRLPPRSRTGCWYVFSLSLSLFPVLLLRGLRFLQSSLTLTFFCR